MNESKKAEDISGELEGEKKEDIFIFFSLRFSLRSMEIGP